VPEKEKKDRNNYLSGSAVYVIIICSFAGRVPIQYKYGEGLHSFENDIASEAVQVIIMLTHGSHEVCRFSVVNSLSEWLKSGMIPSSPFIGNSLHIFDLI
jgi:hypothetical protein